MGLRGLVAAALALVITGCSATSASERTNTATNTATSPTGNQAGSGAFIAASATTLDLNQLDDVLVAELQTFRTTQGMATLKRDAQLDAAAQALATVMARKNDLSHSADGQRAGDRIEDAGYVLCTQGAPWAEKYRWDRAASSAAQGCLGARTSASATEAAFDLLAAADSCLFQCLPG